MGYINKFGSGLSRGMFYVYIGDIHVCHSKWNNRTEHLAMLNRISEFVKGRKEQFTVIIVPYDSSYKPKERKPAIDKKSLPEITIKTERFPFDWI